jgi:hypothetical protein
MFLHLRYFVIVKHVNLGFAPQFRAAAASAAAAAAAAAAVQVQLFEEEPSYCSYGEALSSTALI